MSHTIASYSIVVCRHPTTRAWLAVQETEAHGSQWWLPAGAVEPGETYAQAARREGREEAGIDMELLGILRVEHSVFPAYQGVGFSRQRVVFFAEPVDPTAPLKGLPGDKESLRAEWMTLAQLRALDAKSLRGSELLNWAAYLEAGGHVWPLGVMGEEGEGPQAPPPAAEAGGAPAAAARDFAGHAPWAAATADGLQRGGGGGGGGAPAAEEGARPSLAHAADEVSGGWEAEAEGPIEGAIASARARISLASASAAAEPSHGFGGAAP